MKLIEILKILAPYIRNWNYPISAEHDIIIFNTYYDDIPKDVLETLNELGCFYSDEYDNLIMFV